MRYSDGDWSETFTDLTLPAVGIPIAFGRVYRSRSSLATALGWGWMHSYGMSLRANADGSLTYVTEDLRELGFKKAGTSQWSAPAGWYQTVAKDASGYQMRFKDGLVYRFDLGGKLISEADPNGNTVTLGYDSLGRLSAVTDAAGRGALTLNYDAGGKLANVADAAGRAVFFEHVGEDLVSAQDVLGAVESYGYSSAHKLLRRTDKNGGVWTQLYCA